MRLPEEVQIAVIWKLKSFQDLVSMLGERHQIKEMQWQGTDFVYPAIRVTNVIFPSEDGCGADTSEILISVYSEQKSSKQCSEISGKIASLLHNTSFTVSDGLQKALNVMTFKVTEIPYPTQQNAEYETRNITGVWESRIKCVAKVY